MKIPILILSSVLLLIVSCSNDDTSKKDTDKSNTSKAEVEVRVIELPANDYKRLKGTIGDYPITMEFIKMDSDISGEYYYDKTKIPISISGELKQGSKITFNEYAEAPSPTGIFNGEFYSDGSFKGTWTNPKTKKTLEINLTAQPSKILSFENTNLAKEKCSTKEQSITVNGQRIDGADTTCSNISLQSISVKCEDATLEKTINDLIEMESAHMLGDASTYSELFGLLEKTNYEDGFEVEINTIVNSIYKNFISIEIYSYSYYYETAHPNSHTTIINIDLNTGKRVSFEDLIKREGMNTLVAKSKPIFEAIHGGEEEGWYTFDEFALPNNFAIEANGLYFHYNAYEIGSYAQGAPSVLIPYSKIKGTLKEVLK
ncbi:MAG: hypothetical protein ACJASQ_004124 [Crocinitomicaceae bacterium]|jgi:hypothetical protein